MLSHAVSVTTIGEPAREALMCASQASVLGKTSRGLFLHLFTGWVIFLSFEPYRGPLTLNLLGDTRAFHNLEIGEVVKVSPGVIVFQRMGLSLTISGAEPWQASAKLRENLPVDALRAHVISIAHLAALQPSASQLVAMLPVILGLQEKPDLPPPDYFDELTHLQAACRTGRASAMAEALRAFLGLGAGLTPSGDDLVIGFLLAANRWGERLFPAIATAALNEAIPARAARSTSALSANLIECAARGQADERLVLALDGIVTGIPDAAACLASLAGWGNSSGLDAWVGMALLLHSQPFM